MQAQPPFQRTIHKPVTLSGRGLFFSHPVEVIFRPAPANHGIDFVRADLNDAVIPATVNHVVKRARRTTLRCGEATIDTCEHCLSAVAGLGIDNLIIEVDGPELPGADGSAAPFVEALRKAQIVDQDASRRPLVISEPVMVRKDDAIVAAMPSDGPACSAK